MKLVSKSLAITAAIIALQSAIAGNAPSLPLKSADGCFIVTAADDNLVARAAVLDFAGDIRIGLQKITGWNLKPGFKPILIALDCENTRGIRHQVFLSKDGAIRSQIEIPPATSIDSSRLACEIVSALARVELARNTEPGHTPTDFPDWFLSGLARQMDLSARQSDFEFVWSRWSRGRLESAWTLCGRDSIPPAEDAIASQFVAWLLDHAESKTACAELLRRMGEGNEWGPELIATCFAIDSADFDEDLDMWMLERGRTVLEPGTTTPGAVRRFRSQLLIYPRDFGIPYGDFGMGFITLEELVDHADSPRAKSMANRKTKAILASVVGRDRAVRDAATLFAGMLDAVAKGDAESARAALSAARRRQRVIETAAAAGETLGAKRIEDADTIEE